MPSPDGTGQNLISEPERAQSQKARFGLVSVRPSGAARNASVQQQQQTGVPFIITQQVQPAFMQALMQSQHAWIIAAQSLSPLVQLITHPSLVISTLHLPIVMLQQQQTIPFMTMQQDIIPPCIIMHRFCIIVQDVGSGHAQVIFIPPSHFSIFIVQRGTISMPVGAMPIIGA